MNDLQAIADRVEIEALRGEFTDAAMMEDYDRCVRGQRALGEMRGYPGDHADRIAISSPPGPSRARGGASACPD